MLMAKWVLTAVLGVMALLIDLGNASAPILARRRQRNVSMVPLFGALFGTGACLLCPLDDSARLIPIVVLLDLSVLNLLLFGVRWLVGRHPR